MKQSTEARSTWEREQIRAWQEMGFLAEARKSFTGERILRQLLGVYRGPAPGCADMCWGWVPDLRFRMEDSGDGKEE